MDDERFLRSILRIAWTGVGGANPRALPSKSRSLFAKIGKMKIGILTFHCAYNYGAVLQAFALQEFLRELGHEVEVIDYRPSYLLEPYSAPSISQIACRLFRRAKPLNGNSASPAEKKDASEPKLFWFIDRTKKFLLRTLWRIVRRPGFENFISQKLNLSRERLSKGGAPTQRYDAIIFGSDQIWSLSSTAGGDPIFWGDFPTFEKTLKIAYAASAGKTTEMLREAPAFTNALKNFDAISVREKVLADILEQKICRGIEVVLDPTLIVDKSVWDKIAVPPKRKRKYVLVYQVRHTPAVARIANELAEQIGAEVVSLWVGYGDKPKGELPRETPEQFIGWFRNATCIVTTSFHGTAFSILYEKPLYYVSTGDPAENRPRQILGELELLDRIVAEDAHPKFSEINYSSSRDRLETLCSASREFLEQALVGTGDGNNVGRIQKWHRKMCQKCNPKSNNIKPTKAS